MLATDTGVQLALARTWSDCGSRHMRCTDSPASWEAWRTPPSAICLRITAICERGRLASSAATVRRCQGGAHISICCAGALSNAAAILWL